jgi:hypothetical protein
MELGGGIERGTEIVRRATDRAFGRVGCEAGSPRRQCVFAQVGKVGRGQRRIGEDVLRKPRSGIAFQADTAFLNVLPRG